MRDESYLNITSTPVSCKCKIGLKSPSPSLAVSSVHGRLDPSAERKVARDGISAERERIECLPSASRRVLPAGKERFGPPETQNRPLSALPLPLSLSPRAATATRESEIGRRIEINAPMSKSALARSAIFLPTSQSTSMCQTDVGKRRASALSPRCLSFTAPSYFSRGCWESQAKNEFVADDLVMMCTMMRAGLLRFSLSLTRLIFLYRSSLRDTQRRNTHAMMHTHCCGEERKRRKEGGR